MILLLKFPNTLAALNIFLFLEKPFSTTFGIDQEPKFCPMVDGIVGLVNLVGESLCRKKFRL